MIAIATNLERMIRNSNLFTWKTKFSDDTRFTITNSANLPDGSIERLHGNALTTDVPGQFIVGFVGEPTIVYNVLATDYATYSSVYSCGEVSVVYNAAFKAVQRSV
jgi:hypothetical protein